MQGEETKTFLPEESSFRAREQLWVEMNVLQARLGSTVLYLCIIGLAFLRVSYDAECGIWDEFTRHPESVIELESLIDNPIHTLPRITMCWRISWSSASANQRLLVR